uniref:hypothetical protein n=1 Tax=Echinothamnion hookeri TaxID=2008680 RepID=UPI002551F676|nr:hypothetical protein QQP88_pgt015 [Echinothamnion hookeri]WGH14322.1 hypothetical protein [Echinothamnion hookeri]
MITKQIYIAMKKHDLIYVYKLQKYLINSNEAKVVLINRIFYNLQLYYNNCINIKSLIQDINKIDLFYSLFITRSHINSLFFEQIKQSLIYISIKPTLTAKIAKNLNQLISITPLNYLLNTHKNINSNYFLSKIIIKKISCYSYINKSISQWLNKNICLNLSTVYDLKYINNNTIKQSESNTQASECLYILLSKVMVNDLFWYKFNCIRSNKIVIRSNSYKITDETVNLFNIIVKQLLYTKTYKKFHKISFFNNNKKLLTNVKSLYINYYFSFVIFISLDLITSCNQIINYFIYTLGKKQIISYDHLYKLKKINQLLNKFVYFYNIRYFYENHLLIKEI